MADEEVVESTVDASDGEVTVVGEEVPEKVAGEDYLKKLRAINQGKMGEIQSFGANLDAVSILMLRIDTLVQMALSSEDKVRFETQFEVNMANALDDALRQVRQQILTQGLGGTLSSGPPLRA